MHSLLARLESVCSLIWGAQALGHGGGERMALMG